VWGDLDGHEAGSHRGVNLSANRALRQPEPVSDPLLVIVEPLKTLEGHPDPMIAVSSESAQHCQRFGICRT
jgi:hypothetical protein